jgi:hypothetical protein
MVLALPVEHREAIRRALEDAQCNAVEAFRGDGIAEGG